MVKIILSESKKLIFYGFLAIVVVLFFIYFFKQPSEDVDISAPSDVFAPTQSKNPIGANTKIDLNFFQSDEFRNLRFDKMPSVVFPVGKRDPFVPME